MYFKPIYQPWNDILSPHICFQGCFSPDFPWNPAPSNGYAVLRPKPIFSSIFGVHLEFLWIPRCTIGSSDCIFFPYNLTDGSCFVLYDLMTVLTGWIVKCSLFAYNSAEASMGWSSLLFSVTKHMSSATVTWGMILTVPIRVPVSLSSTSMSIELLYLL